MLSYRFVIQVVLGVAVRSSGMIFLFSTGYRTYSHFWLRGSVSSYGRFLLLKGGHILALRVTIPFLDLTHCLWRVCLH